MSRKYTIDDDVLITVNFCEDNDFLSPAKPECDGTIKYSKNVVVLKHEVSCTIFK